MALHESERKKNLWDSFELSLKGEVDKNEIPYHWHWILFPLLEQYGPELVYAVGLNALGYPPTWVDLAEEAAKVEAAMKTYSGE